MKKVLIVDTTCPEPYDLITLHTRGLGGSEASVVRIAEELQERGYNICIVQHNRIKNVGATYYSPLMLQQSDWIPDIVISFRNAFILPFARQKWPNAKNIVWLTDLVGERFWNEFELIAQGLTTIVTLSNFHQQAVLDVMHGNFFKSDLWRNVRLQNIALPIDDGLIPDTSEVNPHKLVFFSSPIKGLTETLQSFNWLRQRDNRYELHISNPGYSESYSQTMPGVINHGVLTHSEAIKHVRSANAVFYANQSFPETFGLVFAEANAVGTPVIAYDFGSAAEVLASQPNQLIARGNWRKFLDVTQALSENRPKIEAKAEYRLSAVLDKWERLFNE